MHTARSQLMDRLDRVVSTGERLWDLSLVGECRRRLRCPPFAFARLTRAAAYCTQTLVLSAAGFSLSSASALQRFLVRSPSAPFRGSSELFCTSAQTTVDHLDMRDRTYYAAINDRPVSEGALLTSVRRRRPRRRRHACAAVGSDSAGRR